MAAVEITISGVLYDKYNRTQQNVVLIGEASITGLGVGGGPIIPPGQPPSGGQPGIPTFPIAGYPDFPYPSQPIYRPGYPGGAPPPNLGGGTPPDKPPEPVEPPIEWKPIWAGPENGWVVVGIPQGPHPTPSK